MTKRWEAQIWDPFAARPPPNPERPNVRPRKRGRQIYLGSFPNENIAAIAYDRAALQVLGPDTPLNVRSPISALNRAGPGNAVVRRAARGPVGVSRRASFAVPDGARAYRGRPHSLGRGLDQGVDSTCARGGAREQRPVGEGPVRDCTFVRVRAIKTAACDPSRRCMEAGVDTAAHGASCCFHGEPQAGGALECEGPCKKSKQQQVA